MATEWRDAPEVELIAGRLIQEHHTHLAELHISYLFRVADTWASGGKTVLGKCIKVDGREKHLTGYDFVIAVNFLAWKGMTGLQRIALVDHELCHAGVDEAGEPCMWPHDVEEFAAIIARHGLWKPDVEQFGRIAATQLRLRLEDAPGEEHEERRAQAVADELATRRMSHLTDDTQVTLTGPDGTSATTTMAGLLRVADEAIREAATPPQAAQDEPQPADATNAVLATPGPSTEGERRYPTAEEARAQAAAEAQAELAHLSPAEAAAKVVQMSQHQRGERRGGRRPEPEPAMAAREPGF